MNTIKTITLHQIWGSLVTDSLKCYETRSWKTSHRGLLAIHAGKTWDANLQLIAADLGSRFPELRKYIQHTPPLGAVLGICRLVHCYETEAIRDSLSPLERAVGDYSPGRFAWQLQLLEVFDEPIPAKGAQQLWDWQPPKGFFDNRVAIIGSRNFPDITTVYEYVDKLPRDTIVISGGAKGVDTAAEYAAKQCGLKVISIPVLDDEWDLHKTDNGKSYAGNIRNQSIIDMAGRVVAFHFKDSPGTANSIEKVRAAGKPLLINPHLDSSVGEKMSRTTRQARNDVMPIAQDMARTLNLACEQLQIAGSLRRNKPDVKDVELVAVPKIVDGQNALLWVLDRLLEEGAIEKAKLGETGTTRWGNKLRSWVYRGVKFDLFSVQDINFGIEYQLKTGSRDFNVLLMTKLKSAPFQLKEFVAYWNDVPLNIPDEQSWFKLLGLPFIPASERSEDNLKSVFANQWKGWGDPKKFMPQAKQLGLGGDFHIYDEGALISYLEKKEKLKPHSSKTDEKPFEWSKPWLRDDGMVYVFNGWENGQRRYATTPKDSPRARVHARTINGCTYMSETEMLLLWLVQQNKNTIPVSKPVYSGYLLPEAYEFPEKAPVETVPFADMTYTIPDVYESWVWWYERGMSDVDSDGELPQVARFSCGKALLLDGHHRAEAKQRLGRTGMRCMVNDMPMTFEDATAMNEDDGSADLLLFADILEEVYAILQGAKEVEHAGA